MSQLLNPNMNVNNKQSLASSNLKSQDDSRSRMNMDSNKNYSMKGSFTFTVGREESEVKSNEPKIMEQGLDDEMLLTQLALDDREIVIYDIASAIQIGERQRNTPIHTFKCFFDKNSLNFFVELSDKSPFEHLTKTAFMKILDIAEGLGVKNVIVCVHNKTTEIGSTIQTLLFVGFQKLLGEEARRVSRTRTHTLLSFDLTD